MKKIFVFWNEPLNTTGGGIHRCIMNLINYLPDRGYNVDYLYSKDFYQTFILNTPGKNEKIIPLSELRAFLINNKCDVILGQEAVFSASLTKVISTIELSNIKFINQYHSTPLYFQKKLTWDFLKEEWATTANAKHRFSLIAKALLYPVWRWNVKRNQNKIYRYNYENSDITLLLSKNELPHFQKICGDMSLKKCVCINNPLSWPEIASEDILDEKKKEVLIVSRIYNCEKRIDLALKTWKKLQNRGLTNEWTLRIVGEGISEPYLKKMTHKLGLSNVYWEGRQDPLPYYRRASVFLLTSVVEGWALTLTESMQMGVVPIAFDSYPAVREIITDGVDGFLVPAKDLDMLSERLSILMHNPEKRVEMAKTALTSCCRFNTDSIMDQWREMLDYLTSTDHR